LEKQVKGKEEKGGRGTWCFGIKSKIRVVTKFASFEIFS
jgi:hypothetical protein